MMIIYLINYYHLESYNRNSIIHVFLFYGRDAVVWAGVWRGSWRCTHGVVLVCIFIFSSLCAGWIVNAFFHRCRSSTSLLVRQRLLRRLRWWYFSQRASLYNLISILTCFTGCERCWKTRVFSLLLKEVLNGTPDQISGFAKYATRC